MCQSDGSWNTSQPECQPVDCGLPPDIKNALQDKLTGTIFGSKVEYRCRDGYHTEIETSMNCDFDGMWKGDLFECQPVSCGEPPALENGLILGKCINVPSMEYYIILLTLINTS